MYVYFFKGKQPYLKGEYQQIFHIFNMLPLTNDVLAV